MDPDPSYNMRIHLISWREGEYLGPPLFKANDKVNSVGDSAPDPNWIRDLNIICAFILLVGERENILDPPLFKANDKVNSVGDPAPDPNWTRIHHIICAFNLLVAERENILDPPLI